MAKELSCGVHFMRGILLLLNILFVLVGLALIGIGVYVKVSNNFASILEQFAHVPEFEAQSLGFLSFVMIGGGVFTLLLALFGCMGKFCVSLMNYTSYLFFLFKQEHYGIIDVVYIHMPQFFLF
jgi:hypothetical protein